MDVATTLDEGTMALLLLPMPYDELIALAASHPTYQNVVNNSFWIMKLQQDYGEIYDPTSEKSPHLQYFEVFDSADDDYDFVKKLLSKLRKLNVKSNGPLKIHCTDLYIVSSQYRGNTRIGVITRNDIYALCTLQLITLMESNRTIQPNEYLQSGEALTYTNIIKGFATSFNGYTRDNVNYEVHDLDKISALAFDINDVDVWTWKRMEVTMSQNLDIER